MYKSFSMDLAGRTLTVDIDRVAKQANGAALMHYGDTTILSTATASKGTAIEIKTTSSDSGKSGGQEPPQGEAPPDGGKPDGEPPAKPD